MIYQSPVKEEPDSPIYSHGSMKFGITSGFIDEDTFQEIQIRPAYHELSDRQIGFAKGSQILFGDTRLRLNKGKHLNLEKIAVLDIVSAFPRNEFIKATSWEFSTGVEQEDVGAKDDKHVWGSALGFGMTEGSEAWFVSGFIDARTKLNTYLEDNYALGVGPHIRFVMHPSKDFAAELEYFHTENLAGDTENSSRGDVKLRWFPSAEYSLDIYAARVS